MQALMRDSVIIAILLIFAASQLYWLRVLGKAFERVMTSRPLQRALGVLAAGFYLYVLFYNLRFGRGGHSPVHLTLRAALLEAPFAWWLIGSLLGFVIVLGITIAGNVARAAGWAYRKLRAAPKETQPAAFSPGRRRFLEQTALAAGTVPFLAAAYGLLYERLDIETTRKTIRIARLPKAFHGFRIAQLSDIHIGPFMSAEEIRKIADLTNRLKPDLIVLTGDFVTWDPQTQGAVVDALSGLKAPFGVLGCLGNHETYTGTEASITRLFATRGIRILRQAATPIRSNGETLSLIGVDFQGRFGPPLPAMTYLRGVQQLLAPGSVNILLSHNPNSFDRAAELGIDLTLAGHTHGGQVALEFVHRNISPSRLVTDYVKGWFQKGASQLYVNSGLGTILVPIRLNAPPEITLFELVRS